MKLPALGPLTEYDVRPFYFLKLGDREKKAMMEALALFPWDALPALPPIIRTPASNYHLDRLRKLLTNEEWGCFIEMRKHLPSILALEQILGR